MCKCAFRAYADREGPDRPAQIHCLHKDSLDTVKFIDTLQRSYKGHAMIITLCDFTNWSAFLPFSYVQRSFSSYFAPPICAQCVSAQSGRGSHGVYCLKYWVDPHYLKDQNAWFEIKAV